MESYKPKSYYHNIAWLMVFDILMSSGKEMVSFGDEETVAFDIPKKDIYVAQKKLKKFVEVIQPFKNEVTKHTKKKVRDIIEDTIKITLKHKYISPEIIAIHMLFTYFITYDHKKMPECFSYFMNPNNYYSILDRVENSKLVDIAEVYRDITNIIERNR